MLPTEPFTNGTPTESSRERFDVVVIGAGQAGLAIGYFLARQGRRFVILLIGRRASRDTTTA